MISNVSFGDDTEVYANQIDKIISQQFATVSPNHELPKKASDEVFVRRVYLDIVGRIPVYDEVTGFLEDTSEDKRDQLIDTLLSSHGYTNHFYNFWADLLRVDETSDQNRVASYYYQEHIRNFISRNDPYDEFVRGLVKSEGLPWENGAVGFYVRDRGMLLDHSAITSQVFLGTQIECAQCHDHPYDDVTQKEFYELAAYSYGVKSVNGRTGLKDKNFKRMRSEILNKIEGPISESEKLLRDTLRIVYRPLRGTNVEHSKRKLRLPHDYQYENGEAGELVNRDVLYGAVPSDGHAPTELAIWMTVDNDRFTSVITNRMLKKVFGKSLVEPLDEITKYTKSSNPRLSDYLEILMEDLQYDLKGFISILYKTEAYQREAVLVEATQPYSFEAPMFRRMLAEQIWDSIVGMVNPNPESKTENVRGSRRALGAQKIYEGLESLTKDELLEGIVNTVHAVKNKSGELSDSKKKQLERAYKKKDYDKIEKLQNEASNKMSRLQKAVYDNLYKPGFDKMGSAELNERGNDVEADMEKMMGMTQKKRERVTDKQRKKMVQTFRREARKNGAKTREDVQAYIRYRRKVLPKLQRACFLEQPAPKSHFLSEFGQSDRDLVNNSSNEAKVTQALTLWDDRFVQDIVKPYTPLGKKITNQFKHEEIIDNMFLTVLSRQATEDEVETLVPWLKGNREEGAVDILHALLNTKQFLFIQ